MQCSKRILIFGTGDYYQRYCKWLNHYQIIALIDNDSHKQGTLLDGYPVMSPQSAICLKYEFIVILSIHDKEMREQLVSLGVNPKQIYNQNDLYLFQRDLDVKPVRIYKKKYVELHDSRDVDYNAAGKIVIFSNDLYINGASMAVVNVASVLAATYDVIVATSEDGYCRQILNDRCIDVIIDENISVLSMEQIEWLSGARLIICNTIHFYRFLAKRCGDIPTIWWLHEPAFFYEGLDIDILKNISQDNMIILAVSEVAKRACLRYNPKITINIFPVYVDDVEQVNRKLRGKFTFATIGYVRPWKGQDLFIEAIQEIQDFYDDVEFLIIGDNSSCFAQKLKVAENSKVHFLGEMSPEKLNDMYKNIDVVVCPSRIESLSIVVIEAMIRDIPSIVSSSAGVAEYITDGLDGWIFTSENVDELKDKMIYAIENRNKVSEVGGRSREIYEKFFSKKVFSDRLLKIVKEMISG